MSALQLSCRLLRRSATLPQPGLTQVRTRALGAFWMSCRPGCGAPADLLKIVLVMG